MDKPLTSNFRPDGTPVDISAYERAGGYEGLRKALRLQPQDVAEMVKRSNLRGRGGAGFPTGVKWSLVPMGADAPKPKYLVANADEMEPGTFKDRVLMEGDPFAIVEGMAIAALVTACDRAFIYLRGEYALACARIRNAIAASSAAGLLGS